MSAVTPALVCRQEGLAHRAHEYEVATGLSYGAAGAAAPGVEPERMLKAFGMLLSAAGVTDPAPSCPTCRGW